jgi:hypothetical protein
MYSIMLHMKTRVTFRIAPELADALRELPNQTQFVEAALRDALGLTCPTCAGSGRVVGGAPEVTNFRRASLPALDPESGRQLRAVVQLARRLAATKVDLVAGDDEGLDFSLARHGDVLLRGRLHGGATTMH